MTSHRPTQGTPTANVAAADALAADLERIVMGSVGLTTLALEEAGAGFELTFTQWRALLVLGESDDGARIGEVAARVRVTLPATSRLLRRLERRGLTTLAVDDQDRRATRARLTDRGRAVREAILAHRRATIRGLARGLREPALLNLADGIRAIAIEFERFE
jgi:DNA-binding MarR family transcriptional regulator